MKPVLVVATVVLVCLFGAANASAGITFENQWSLGSSAARYNGGDTAVGTDGSVFVLSSAGQISKFTPAGDLLLSWKLRSKNATALATDPTGKVLVAGSSRIERFSPEGKRLRSISLRWKSERRRKTGLDVIAIDVSDTGEIFLVNFQDGVIRLSSSGKRLGTIGGWGFGRGEFLLPGDGAVGPDGRLYVTEAVDTRVQVFGPRGNFTKAWKKEGSGPGEFRSADSVATDDLGRVYVADNSLSRIQIFDADGRYLDQIGSEGGTAGRFRFIQSISTGLDGQFYVSDQRGTRVQRFTYDGGEPFPQAQIDFSSVNFLTAILPGKQFRPQVEVSNFGNAAATEISICPFTKSKFSRKLFRGVACQTIDSIGAGETRRVTFRLKVPRGTPRREVYLPSLVLRSGNAGGGSVLIGIYTGRNLDWFDF